MLQRCLENVQIRLLVCGEVTAMPLEEYLGAVVPAEMPASWPLEALKAQAVAARTYALHAHVHPRHGQADLCAGQHCQVWHPPAQHPGTDEAIAATAGEVLLWQGEPLCAMYSANCGGHTDDGSAPYLRGVSCPAAGPRRGHGLGLCQHGARVLAEQGLSYRQILAHYYTLPDKDASAWEERLRATAWESLGVAYNPEAALARYAHASGLGAPLGPERDVSIADIVLRLQLYSGGIVFVPVGEWQAVQHIGW